MSLNVDNGPDAPPDALPAECNVATVNAAAARALVVLFLALIFAVPLAQLGIELHRGQSPKALDLFSRPPTAANLRAYEKGLESASAVADQFRPWIQAAQFQMGADGGEKALIGRDGWLFYKPGFDSMMVKLRPVKSIVGSNDPLAAIVEFRNELATRDIQLLVMIAPDKESVYPDRLTLRAKHLHQLQSPITRALLDGLQAARIETVDLFQLFAEARDKGTNSSLPALYLAQDTHWSPAGVSLAARAVAQRLLELRWAAKGSVPFAELPLQVSRKGDVLRMLQIPTLERRSQPEIVECAQIVQEPGPHLYRDDPMSDVLVLGDSFLRIYQQDEPGAAGFIAHLARHLQRPVSSLVADGGASTLVRQELYERPKLLNGKKVVVWEFVERDIRLGAEGWQFVPLPPAPADRKL